MCEKCYSYIYDFLLTPLSITHMLRDHIELKAFTRCSHEVTQCISRALKKYVEDQILVDCFKLFRETYEENQKVLDTLEIIEIPKGCKEHNYDAFIWIKFKETQPDDFRELNHAIQICMDNMVVKKIRSKEQLLEHFFMHKFRHLLHVLPDIHREHTEKKGFENTKSLGSVPQHRLNYIRRMAGLHVKEEVYITINEFDELYN